MRDSNVDMCDILRIEREGVEEEEVWCGYSFLTFVWEVIKCTSSYMSHSANQNIFRAKFSAVLFSLFLSLFSHFLSIIIISLFSLFMFPFSGDFFRYREGYEESRFAE